MGRWQSALPGNWEGGVSREAWGARVPRRRPTLAATLYSRLPTTLPQPAEAAASVITSRSTAESLTLRATLAAVLASSPQASKSAAASSMATLTHGLACESHVHARACVARRNHETAAGRRPAVRRSRAGLVPP